MCATFAPTAIAVALKAAVSYHVRPFACRHVAADGLFLNPLTMCRSLGPSDAAKKDRRARAAATGTDAEAADTASCPPPGSRQDEHGAVSSGSQTGAREAFEAQPANGQRHSRGRQ